MGNAFAKMQETLEGKKYVEQYVQNLTHEIKSPLSAIRGAAELLEEEMPPEQ
jgi:two-component system sensor histidine kinase CreC